MAKATKAEDRPGAGEWVPAGADLDALRGAAEKCRGCELWRDATQVVFEGIADHRRVDRYGLTPPAHRQGPDADPEGRELLGARDGARRAGG